MKPPPRPVPRPLPRGLAVPSGRLARLARIGGLATGLAGEALARGARELAQGRAPRLGDLLLTPSAATRFADELSRMRGAAMKLGQLLSMEAGDLLPPELSEILARLRAEAHPMPPRQLDAALAAEWGAGWRRRFERFDVRPVAAASIGQVHRARTRDGRDLAIKVQYPGVRRSIDSDVDNLAALIRLSGLAPPGLDLAPLLAESKRQLHEEADYEREAAQLTRFRALLADRPGYLLPEPLADLTTRGALAMTWCPGAPVEALAEAPQAERDRAMTLLVDLLLHETFAFGLIQSDPNFANYRWDAAGGRLVLLDFGAAREVPPALSEGFRALARAGLSGDPAAIEAAALALGLLAADAAPTHRRQVADLAELAAAPLRAGGLFDFGDRALAARLKDGALALAADRSFVHVPPVDVLHVQRKTAGVYLLGRRIGARAPVRALLDPHLAG